MKKNIFITGATSGIGKACAEKFAAAGYNIVINGRREEKLAALKNQLEADFPIEVVTACFDVQDKEAVFSGIQSLNEKWKNIDVLINNAGLALGRDSFDEADMDDWKQMMDTNVNGLLYVTKALLPAMIQNKSGHIINIGSIAGKEVYENGNVYCASKYAVDAITKSLRVDLLKHQIKVTGIHPGSVETEFSIVRYKGDQSKAAAAYKGYVPLQAIDIADAIFYCAELPKHVCINDLVISCTAQAGTYYFNKSV